MLHTTDRMVNNEVTVTNDIDLPALVAKVVKEQRQSRGWTQQQLADHLAELGSALGRVGVARIETEARPVSVQDAAYLAGAFEIPVSTLLGEQAPRERRLVKTRLGQLAHEIEMAWGLVEEVGPGAVGEVEEAVGAMEREMERQREDLRLYLKQAKREESER
jgi:transcriptional regulator with XRE-family HTH domain